MAATQLITREFGQNFQIINQDCGNKPTTIASNQTHNFDIEDNCTKFSLIIKQTFDVKESKNISTLNLSPIENIIFTLSKKIEEIVIHILIIKIINICHNQGGKIVINPIQTIGIESKLGTRVRVQTLVKEERNIENNKSDILIGINGPTIDFNSVS